MTDFFAKFGKALRPAPDFLPVSPDELVLLGRPSIPHFVIITGDAYVDHPSFGASLIGKLLWSLGWDVGVIAAPDMKNPEAFSVFSAPSLGFLITSGNVDSMVNNYSVAKKKRAGDDYAEGGKGGLRPDRALTAYCLAVRKRFGDIPVIIGGLEASLRRLSHYDYWSASVKKPVIIDAQADLLVYGMGEMQIVEIADALAAGVPVSALNYINGTVYTSKNPPENGVINLPSFEESSSDKTAFARSYKAQYENTDYRTAKALAEKCGSVYAVQNIPAPPLTREELDYVYGLNYARAPHPSYSEEVPSVQEVRFSITSSRGCFGACNFCALSFHQGRHVASRSHESILAEAETIIKLPGFKGYIHDVGGPTANFRNPSCKTKKAAACKRKCLAPEPCGNLDVSHEDYLCLLRKLRALPGVKKVFVRSGIRFDYLMLDEKDDFFNDLVLHHISGQLKVAPEHVSENVLLQMGKPGRKAYDRFVKKYHDINDKHGKKQFLVPYLMSSHPGSGLAEAVELSEYLRDNKVTPEQVQDFYPTPGTVSTCMYHTGIDPLTMKKVYCACTPHEKAMQRALIQYKNPKNYDLVYEALIKAGRRDLIGYGPKCLLRPKRGAERPNPPAPAKTSNRYTKKKTIRNVHKKKSNEQEKK